MEFFYSFLIVEHSVEKSRKFVSTLKLKQVKGFFSESWYRIHNIPFSS
jgi:hypothetical protein